MPENYHGVSPFAKELGVDISSTSTSYSLVASSCISDLADEKDNVVAITAAMESGTKLSVFREKHPDRFFDVGIAEQHAMTMAAGMASKGLKPYFSVYSTFLQRAYDQLIHDVCLQNLPVTLMLDRCGLVGDDGPTHHGVFDMPVLLSIPNLTIYSPYDEAEISYAVNASYQTDSPVVIRYPRGKAPENTSLYSGDVSDCVFVDGDSSVTVISFGKYTSEVLEAIDILEKDGISVNHLHLLKLKPLDIRQIADYLASTKYVITIEDSTSTLGFGVYIKELLAEIGCTYSFTSLGYPDEYIEQGKVDLLSEKLGLTAAAISLLAKSFMDEEDHG